MRRLLGSGLLIGALWGCPNPDARDAPAAAAAPDPEPSGTPDWKAAFRYEVKAEPEAVVIEFHLQDGFHAYAQGETIGRPLKLALDEGPVRPAGPVQYPDGETKDLPMGRSVTVEGDGTIRAPVSFDGERATATGTFHYQVCTDRMCDRPRSQPFQVEFKKGGERKKDGASG